MRFSAAEEVALQRVATQHKKVIPLPLPPVDGTHRPQQCKVKTIVKC